MIDPIHLHSSCQGYLDGLKPLDMVQSKAVVDTAIGVWIAPLILLSSPEIGNFKPSLTVVE